MPTPPYPLLDQPPEIVDTFRDIYEKQLEEALTGASGTITYVKSIGPTVTGTITVVNGRITAFT